MSLLSLERCRALLPRSNGLNDAQLENLRDAMYLLAGAAVDGFLAHKRAGNCDPHENQGASDAAVYERAAIIEFDSKCRRDEAEHLAGIRGKKRGIHIAGGKNA